jgi:O-antigen/teichoic acid export membrane protein
LSFNKIIPTKELLNSKEFRLTALLFASQIIFLMVGFANKSIQTKEFGPEIYGHYAFFISVLMFTSLFFHMGFFTSTQVLIAENQDKQKEREFIGAGFLYFLLVGLIYSIFVYATAELIDKIYDLSFSDLFKKLSFLAPLFIFRFYINAVSTGSGKVLGISLFELSGRAIFLISMVSLIFLDKFTLSVVLTLNLLSLLFGASIVLAFFKPSFSNLKIRSGEIWAKNKSHGFHLFIGGVLQQSTYKLDEMMIPYFVGSTGLGFYTLAGLLCAPIPMLSQSASRSLFRKMAHGEKITDTLFRFNFLWLIFSSLGLVLAVHWIVPILFGPGYEQVAGITSILIIAYILQGLFQPFSFLNAKSQGKKVRNAQVYGTIVNVIGNFAFIPIWGITGAIIASIFSRATTLGLFYFYYKKYLKELS